MGATTATIMASAGTQPCADNARWHAGLLATEPPPRIDENLSLYGARAL